MAELEALILAGDAPTLEDLKEKPTDPKKDVVEKATKTDPEEPTTKPKTEEADGWDEWGKTQDKKPEDKKDVDWKTKYHKDVTLMKQKHEQDIANAVAKAKEEAKAEKSTDVDMDEFDESTVKMTEKIASDVVAKSLPKTQDYILTETDEKELDAFLEAHPEAAEHVEDLIYYKWQLRKASFSKIYRNRIQEDKEEAPPAPTRATTAWQSSAGAVPNKTAEKGASPKYSEEEILNSFAEMAWMK